MIITAKDIAEFEQTYERYLDDDPSDECAVKVFYEWLLQHPQVLMCGGFQEYVSAYELSIYRRLAIRKALIRARRPVVRTYTGQWVLPSTVSQSYDSTWDGYSLRGLDALPPDPTDEQWEECVIELPSAGEMIEAARRFANSPLIDPTVFVSASLWTPERQSHELNALRNSALGIIGAIRDERLELASVSPRIFEELVAELLASQGMKIHVVRETPQGGRDIIARGQLIPGFEPLTIAVEVKHRPVVYRPDVQMALQQNRQFPALLFVTSGRFSAGVIREARQPENKMRLFLQDGVAIREILRTFKL
jgi:HJR/Mrr/RecB family endonuclease